MFIHYGKKYSDEDYFGYQHPIKAYMVKYLLWYFFIHIFYKFKIQLMTSYKQNLEIASFVGCELKVKVLCDTVLNQFIK